MRRRSLRRVVLRVVDRHLRHLAVGRPAFQEALHDLRHAEQRREGEEDHAAGRVGARQALAVDLERRLLVEPDQVERLALPLLAALVVGS